MQLQVELAKEFVSVFSWCIRNDFPNEFHIIFRIIYTYTRVCWAWGLVRVLYTCVFLVKSYEPRGTDGCRYEKFTNRNATGKRERRRMDNVKKKTDVVVPWERPPSWVLVTVYIIIICVLLYTMHRRHNTAVAQSSRLRNDDNNTTTMYYYLKVIQNTVPPQPRELCHSWCRTVNARAYTNRLRRRSHGTLTLKSPWNFLKVCAGCAGDG